MTTTPRIAVPKKLERVLYQEVGSRWAQPRKARHLKLHSFRPMEE